MTTVYRELVVRGKANTLKGFMWGFKAARKIKKGLLFCADYPIQTHHLKEIFALKGDHVHIIAAGRVNDALVAAIQESAEPLDLKIVSDRRISGARFEFKFETFSRNVAKELKQILRRMPVSLELYNYKPTERIDPSAKGPELYSPVHDYEFKGKGRIRGDIEALILLHNKLDYHTFIEVEDIHLVH